MQSLSQKEYSNLKELYESIYAPKEELTEEILEEVFNELVDELIEEGCVEEEAIDIIESATDEYIEEAKVTFGHDTTPTRASGAPIGARRRYGMRKVGQAVKAAKGAASGAYKTAKAKAASAAVDVSLAGSMAKKKAGEVKQAVKDAPDKAKAAVSAAASDAKKKAKSGIKGFIKRQAQKVVKRMSEEIEAIEEDSRRMSNKQHTKRVRSNIKAFGSDYTTPSNYDPDANRGQGEVLTRKQIEKKRRKSLRQEELEATGLFTVKEIEAIMESDLDQMQKDADANRARAAKLKDRNVTKGSASFAAAKVADDVKKAARTGPQQHKGTRTGGYRVEGKEEVEVVDENRAAMGRINKEYHRKKEAEAMAARVNKDKKAAPTNRKNDNPMYDPSVNTRATNFKFTPT